MRDWHSVWDGIRVMARGEWHRHWFLELRTRPGLWVHAWTPIWHAGRGPYLTCGIGWLAFGRGY